MLETISSATQRDPGRDQHRAIAEQRRRRSRTTDRSAATPAPRRPAPERRSGSRPICAAVRSTSILALKRARRSAQNTASTSAHDPAEPRHVAAATRDRGSAPATTPKAIASDSESSSAPNRLSPRSSRAMRAVEPVEHAGDHDHRDRRFPFAADREADAGQAEAQRQRGDRIGRDRAQRQAARHAARRGRRDRAGARLRRSSSHRADHCAMPSIGTSRRRGRARSRRRRCAGRAATCGAMPSGR